jgi:hypothetical protein
MAVSNTTVKQACADGDKVTHTFYIFNGGTDLCVNATGTFTVPDGVSLNYRMNTNSSGSITPTASKGTFDPIADVWRVGDLAAGEKQTIEVEFEIIDETLFGADDFIVEFEITSNCKEDADDNVAWLCIEKYCPSVVEDNICESINIALK